MKLFDATFNAIERKLDLSIKRHAVLSGNVANQETPGYKAREYDFAGEVEKALDNENSSMKITNKKHMSMESEAGAHVSFDKSMPVGADGNNVDLDIEMGKLAANSREYSGAINLLAVKLKMLKTAASGGRGGF